MTVATRASSNRIGQPVEAGAPIADPERMSDIREFPPGFLWGAATASHQVEGGNRWNDWWEYEQSGRLPHRSGDCCQHYDRYEQDFDLARSWSHNCHRLSIEWSRIEPEEGRWNRQAVDHYAKVIRALRDRNIEPVITLQHFTVPSWFLDRGGWEASDSPKLFARFVSYFLQHLSEPVTWWLTINEPTVFAQQAYVNGQWPPQKHNAWIAAGKVLRNLARAHVNAYRIVKESSENVHVGFAHNALHIEPCNPERRMDRLCATLRDLVLNRLFFRLIGMSKGIPGHDRRNLDFIGLNYYTRCCVASNGYGPAGFLGRACKLDHHDNTGHRSTIGWEVYPRGLAFVLDRFASYGLPLFITENGIATDNDELRCDFLKDHLEVLAGAIADGRSVLGYLHWSLIDNFEWSLGTAPCFGLAEVDYATQERKPRSSANLYAQICRDNRIKVT